MKKDINLLELKEAIGEEAIKDLLNYIRETIKKGIDEGINCSQSYIDKLDNINNNFLKKGISIDKK